MLKERKNKYYNLIINHEIDLQTTLKTRKSYRNSESIQNYLQIQFIILDKPSWMNFFFFIRKIQMQ